MDLVEKSNKKNQLKRPNQNGQVQIDFVQKCTLVKLNMVTIGILHSQFF
jgi:hypothetical protein